MNTFAPTAHLAEHVDCNQGSSVSFSILFGPSLAIDDTVLAADTRAILELFLNPGQSAVIGRAHGCEVPYLDPAFRPTSLVPGTGETILRGDDSGRDLCVSRGHFTLTSISSGLLLVNGVPRRGGGIRPPRNGTLLLDPVQRQLDAGEERIIYHGSAVTLQLPNGSQVRIEAR